MGLWLAEASTSEFEAGMETLALPGHNFAIKEYHAAFGGMLSNSASTDVFQSYSRSWDCGEEANTSSDRLPKSSDV